MAQEPNLAELALGAAVLALSGGLTWLWQRITGVEARLETRITEVRAAATSDTRDLWIAINEDRRTAAAARERTLERLMEIPTKTELAALEARLVAQINRQSTHP